MSEIIDLAIRRDGNLLTLKRIEREMQTLLGKHVGEPEIYWLVLAFTAFLQSDNEECIRRLQAALKLAPHDVTILGNAGSILANIGEPRRAADIGGRLAEVANDVNQFRSGAQLLGMALRFEEAAEIMEKHGLSQDSIALSTRRLVEVAHSRRVPAETRLRLLESAIAVVRARGFPIRQAALRHYPDDSLRYELFIDADAETCGEINFEIAEALVEQFEDCYPELVTFACRPLTSYTFQDTYVEVAR
ncbi:hypothetical protein [Paraburkholderia kururiensis]|uniref:Tetratricopeptide repeat protein n=1 Tax=Paraburkholderia kururiensis TaxID=984307 RepID=A0ABZ0WST4_9BURK|nr:hypothetical protein [Paraburkholderia kururiensis]WQD80281.1 hypothetical protein U0042_11685 [Paraburkholderia kururiensis]